MRGPCVRQGQVLVQMEFMMLYVYRLCHEIEANLELMATNVPFLRPALKLIPLNDTNSVAPLLQVFTPIRSSSRKVFICKDLVQYLASIIQLCLR